VTDCNGTPVNVGDKVWFRRRWQDLSDEWVEGVVMEIKVRAYYNDREQRIDVEEARVEGDIFAAWVDDRRIRVQGAE
jgi:hypothetical protein